MKPEDMDWMLTQARLSEIRMIREQFYDLVMMGTHRDELIDTTFEQFRNRVTELEAKL